MMPFTDFSLLSILLQIQENGYPSSPQLLSVQLNCFSRPARATNLCSATENEKQELTLILAAGGAVIYGNISFSILSKGAFF